MVSIREATTAAREFARNVLEANQHRQLRLEELESSTVDGKPVDLTSVEFNLLEVLLREAGRVVPRERGGT